MDADPGARLRLENMRQADQALRNALPPRGGDNFEALLTERVMGRSGAPAKRRWLVPWAVAASLAGVDCGIPAAAGGCGQGAGGCWIARWCVRWRRSVRVRRCKRGRRCC